MIQTTARIGLVVTAAILTAACQTESRQVAVISPAPVPVAAIAPTSPPTAMDGAWAATDGVFVANFQGGAFTSRFTKTNEILAQGTYRVSGDTVTMDWLSVATQEKRSATCTISGANSVRCQQGGGQGFELQRSA